jgi:hypothetical protein
MKISPELVYVLSLKIISSIPNVFLVILTGQKSSLLIPPNGIGADFLAITGAPMLSLKVIDIIPFPLLTATTEQRKIVTGIEFPSS